MWLTMADMAFKSARSSADIKFEDYIQVTGQLKPVSEVTVRTSEEGDDENDIPSRVIFGGVRWLFQRLQ